MRLQGFGAAEEAMILQALKALESAGYSTDLLQVLIRVDMPTGFRAMCLDHDGAALGEEAFSSQAMLNHALEEELLHLRQKAAGQAAEYGPETARALEEDVNAIRRFPLPAS